MPQFVMYVAIPCASQLPAQSAPRTPLTAMLHSFSTKPPRETTLDGAAAPSPAFPSAGTRDWLTWVSKHSPRFDNRADHARLYNTLCHCHPHQRVFAMEVGEKEGCRWAKVRGIRVCASNQVTDRTREMQLFLFGYIIVSICEIFTVGGFPLNSSVRIVCLDAYKSS
jgi:hypothetical protein